MDGWKQRVRDWDPVTLQLKDLKVLRATTWLSQFHYVSQIWKRRLFQGSWHREAHGTWCGLCGHACSFSIDHCGFGDDSRGEIDSADSDHSICEFWWDPLARLSNCDQGGSWAALSVSLLWLHIFSSMKSSLWTVDWIQDFNVFPSQPSGWRKSWGMLMGLWHERTEAAALITSHDFNWSELVCTIPKRDHW